MPSPFEIRKVYSFDVYPAALLGTDFKNVTVLGVMDRDTANKEIDTQAMHINIYPFLPTGTPNNPDGYDYVRIKTSAGQTTILGIAWIVPDSIKLIESRTITVTIGGVAASDVNNIKNALVMNGYNQLDIVVK